MMALARLNGCSVVVSPSNAVAAAHRLASPINSGQAPKWKETREECSCSTFSAQVGIPPQQVHHREGKESNKLNGPAVTSTTKRTEKQQA